MNYVAHCLLAETESPEFRFGSVAPDLVGMAGCRLQRLNLSDRRDLLSVTENDVQDGIDFHIYTDQVFDDLDLFKLLKRQFREEVAPDYFPVEHKLTRMYADVGTEMLLDGLVMERWPESKEIYKETILSVGNIAMSIATTEPNKFIQVTKSKQGRLPDYTDPEIVSGILAWRVQNRPKLKIYEDDLPNLSRAFDRHKDNVWEIGETLFLQTKEAVETRLRQSS